MKNEQSYLGQCVSAYRKITETGIGHPGAADPLLEFSILRLAKVAINAGDSSLDWPAVYARCRAEIAVVPERAAGETVGLSWPIHPGAAWMAARGNGEYAKPFLDAAEKLVKEGHRNGDGLFDDPRYPGHLSTEIAAMTIPALAWAGVCAEDERFFSEAIRQFEGYKTVLYDPATRLWHPGYLPGRATAEMWRFQDKMPQSQELYLKHTGRYAGCWGRGEGYALFALSELVFELPDGHPKKAALLKLREDMLSGVLQYQDPNGMWHQVLDDWGSYAESSGSAWILYAMGRALKRGTVDRSRFLIPCQKGLAGLSRYLIWDGGVFNVSQGCVCPGGRGTAADYALLGWQRNPAQGFAPVVLALQLAFQLELHDLIPSFSKVAELFPGDEK